MKNEKKNKKERRYFIGAIVLLILVIFLFYFKMLNPSEESYEPMKQEIVNEPVVQEKRNYTGFSNMLIEDTIIMPVITMAIALAVLFGIVSWIIPLFRGTEM